MPDTAETIHADIRRVLLRRLATMADAMLESGDTKALKSLQTSLTASIGRRSRWLENTQPPATIVRRDAAGEPDDIAIADVDLFRMERMGFDRWWIAVYRGDQRMSMFLTCDFDVDGESVSELEIAEDELEADDDTAE